MIFDIIQDKLAAGRKITSSWTYSYIFKRSGKSNQCYSLYRQISFSCLSQTHISLIITEIFGRKENTYWDKMYVLFSLSFLLGNVSINVTLWHVRINIVAMRSAEMSSCALLSYVCHCKQYKSIWKWCLENVTMHSISVVKAHVVVNNIKLLIVAWRSNNEFHLHYCRDTEYFVLQSTYIALHVKYTIFLFCFNQFFFLGRFCKRLQYWISRKSIQWDPKWYMRTDGWTDRRDLGERAFNHKSFFMCSKEVGPQ